MQMTCQQQQQAVGIIGGTFNPVHIGHMRAAIEFAEAFALTEVRLLPCHQPPHRELPEVSPWHRKEMLELAISGLPHFKVDDRELNSDHCSYTISSLRQIRKELGENIPLYFALGADAFNKIDTWKDWKELFTLANFVVMHRPATQITFANALLESKLRIFTGEHIVANAIYELVVSSLDISSTKIRQLIQSDCSIKFLIPEAVEQYIYQHHLYR